MAQTIRADVENHQKRQINVKKFFIIAIFFLIIIMPKRFETFKISSFLGGEGQEFFDQPNRFYESQKIFLDKKKGTARIADQVAYTDPVNIDDAGRVVQFTDGYFYKLAKRIDTGLLAIFRSADGITNWSKVYDFAAGGGSHYAYEIFMVKEKMVVIIDNGYSAQDRVYYSTNPTTTWTYTNQYVATGAITSNVCEGENSTFIVTSWGEVWETVDGIVYNKIFTGGGRFMAAEYFKGFVYIIVSDGPLEKNELVRLENAKIYHIRNFKAHFPPSIKKLGDNLLIALYWDHPELYFYDGATFRYLGSAIGYSGVTGVKIVGATNERAFVAVAHSENQPNGYPYTINGVYRYTMSVDETGAFVKEQDLGAGVVCKKVYENGAGNIIFDSAYWSNVEAGRNRVKYTSWDSYYSSATITSSKIEIGPHIPIGLIVSFEPDIYRSEGDTHPFIKQNIRIATYFDDLATKTFDVADVVTDKALKYLSYANGATDIARAMSHAEYKYINTNKATWPFVYNLVKFIITLEVSDDTTKTPEIRSLTYIYEPVGLAQAE